jgi:hypothetical protein
MRSNYQLFYKAEKQRKGKNTITNYIGDAKTASTIVLRHFVDRRLRLSIHFIDELTECRHVTGDVFPAVATSQTCPQIGAAALCMDDMAVHSEIGRNAAQN